MISDLIDSAMEVWHEWVPTDKQKLRKSQLELKRTSRVIARQIQASEAKEKACIREMQEHARQKSRTMDIDLKSLKIKSKQVSKMKRYRREMEEVLSNIEGLEQEILRTGATSAINTAIRTSALSIARLTNVVNPSQGAQSINNLRVLHERMDQFNRLARTMNDEFAGDASDEELDLGDEAVSIDGDPEAQAVLNQVLESTGLRALQDQLPSVPVTRPPPSGGSAPVLVAPGDMALPGMGEEGAQDPSVDELTLRLQRLKASS